MAKLTFNQAKKRFTKTVKKMQADLQKYAESDKATQRVVDARLGIINQLIEFYDVFTEYVLLIEEQNHRLNKIRWDTQKLVYWCKIHRVNPNAVFLYSEAELKNMIARGRRFGRTEEIMTATGNSLKSLFIKFLRPEDIPMYNFMPDEDVPIWDAEVSKYLEVHQKLQIDATYNPTTRKPLALI